MTPSNDHLAMHRHLLADQLWTERYLDDLSRAVVGLHRHGDDMVDAYMSLAGSGELPQVQDNIERYLTVRLWPLVRQLKSRRDAVARALATPLDPDTLNQFARRLRQS